MNKEKLIDSNMHHFFYFFFFVHVHKCLKCRNAQNKHRNKNHKAIILNTKVLKKNDSEEISSDSLPHCSFLQRAWLSKSIQLSDFGHHHILQRILGNELQRLNIMHLVLLVNLTEN